MHQRPLELYIHIPFCVKKCQYCDFLSFGIGDSCCQDEKELVSNDYIDALCREIRWYGGKQEYKQRPVVSVFFGGGTPSLMTGQQILRVMTSLRANFSIQKDAEITIEANPGTVTLSKLKEYRLHGINRLSIGLQSTNEKELKILGRIHNYETFCQCFSWAREAGFENINIDLMTALPEQTKESYRHTLEQVLNFKPEHISAYSLIIEPGTPFEDLEERGLLNLPDEDTEREMYELTREILDKAGYKRYEISNYAKEGYECRHNIGYWNRTDYLGLGLGSSSLMGDIRFSNTTDLKSYLDGKTDVETWYGSMEKLSTQSAMEEFMFLGLRMISGISEKDFEDQFGVAVMSVYGDVIKKYVMDGFLKYMNGQICLTNAGLDVANQIMADFLL